VTRILHSVEPADLLTPVAAFLKLTGVLPGGAQNAFLLESIEGGVAGAIRSSACCRT